ncbi:MAG: hypothetical protein WD230_03650 [Cucumibacter sp.]
MPLNAKAAGMAAKARQAASREGIGASLQTAPKPQQPGPDALRQHALQTAAQPLSLQAGVAAKCSWANSPETKACCAPGATSVPGSSSALADPIPASSPLAVRMSAIDNSRRCESIEFMFSH